ncbi:MAG: FAD-dependent oxidoreductase, partial [Bradyrhizobium sp.]
MLDRLSPDAEEMAREWIGAFGAAVRDGSARALSELFVSDSHWRNIFGLSWQFATISHVEQLVPELLIRAAEVHATEFRIDTATLAPRKALVAGREVIEAIFTFTTVNGPGIGSLRLLVAPAQGGLAKAWTISTTLDFDAICEARSRKPAITSHARDFAAPDWREQRQASSAFEGREPDVLIVGGGHAGISAAVELKRIGCEVVVIDKEARVGDNWRLRYRGLKLHNKTPVNHLRYLPFPVTFPDYIPKDQIADFLGSYVDIMEVDFWTKTTFEGAAYDEQTQRWTARLKRGDNIRTLRPKHIVLATSVSGTPNIPKIDGIENFAGQVLHS